MAFPRALLLFPLCAALPAQDVGGEIILVEGRQAQGVEAVGKWTRLKTCLEGQGPRVELLSERALGKGDFAVRVRLAVHGIPKSGAGCRIGSAFLGFAGGKKNEPFVRGALFHGGKNRTTWIKNTTLPDGQPFDLELRRGEGVVSFFVEGKRVHKTNVGGANIGRVSLVPGKAKMRVLRWSIRGDLVERRAFEHAELAALQPKIDSAIDRGAEYILGRQLADGSWGYRAKHYRGGTTGLCVYTLLKAGLPASHPSVRRGLAYLEETQCYTTYAAACQMMALQAAGSTRYHEKMQAILDDLLRWNRGGHWGYPGRHTGGNEPVSSFGRPDLSNTQYAVLGLRAAWLAGLEVPTKVWRQIASRMAHYQERERKVKTIRFEGKTITGKSAVAGFGYVPYRSKPTGSMTTAGISMLAICDAALGEKLGKNLRRNLHWSIQKGVAWLDANWSVTNNPGHGSWHYYYLYGLERVGSLLGLQKIGRHPWYLDGARLLVARQAKGGNWTGGDLSEVRTCFAVLFLKRATRAVATGRGEKKKRDLHAAVGEKCAVQIRGAGEQKLAVWMTGFSKKVREQHGEHGVRVAEVRYLVNGREFAKHTGDARQPWNGETFPARHTFMKPGTYTITAEARIVKAEAPRGATSPLVTLKCPGFKMNVRHVFLDWMRGEAESISRNLLPRVKVEARASTTDGRNKPALVADGLSGTRWLCKPGDKDPALDLELDRRVRANTIVLRPACSRAGERGWFDRVRKVEVVLGKRTRYEITLAKDEMEPTTFVMPKTVNVTRVRVRILERVSGGARKGRAGFSEVALELRKPQK